MIHWIKDFEVGAAWQEGKMRFMDVTKEDVQRAAATELGRG